MDDFWPRSLSDVGLPGPHGGKGMLRNAAGSGLAGWRR